MNTTIIITSFNNLQLEAKLVLPKSREPKGILVYNRGTVFAEEQSVLNNTNFENIFSFLVKDGYALLLPEFIGFGATKKYPHPYHIDKYLCVNSYLLIKEALKHLKTVPPKLIITGYSEGAYIGCSLLRKFEDDLLKIFSSIHTILGGGLYDVYGSIKNGLTKEEYKTPEYIAYLFHAYSYYYKLKLEDIFNKKYIEEINGSFLHQKRFPSELTNNLDELFQKDFKSNIAKNMESILKENTLLSFSPKTKLILFHGICDEIVSYKNTQKLYNSISSKKDINMILKEGLDHMTGGAAYFEIVIKSIYNKT